MEKQYKKLQGNRYGRLKVMAYHGRDKRGNVLWFCECDCGGIKVLVTSSLVNGLTKSCGCIGKEKPSHLIHGGCGTRLYTIWKSIKRRCNKENLWAKNYGHRGIKVCKEWGNSYTAFMEWALSNGYDEKLTIDRVNNNGNYEPSNCRWATYTQQVRNRRNTVMYEVNGEVKPLIEWAEIYGESYKKAIQRLRRGSPPFNFDL